ncbi:MAG TPA: FecR family protein [Spirochaetota bacterium]|nr:FecR family protein [Spirochaetota bacterium]
MKIRTSLILCALAAAALVYACKKETPGEVPAEKPVFNFRVQSVFGDVKIIAASGEKKAAMGDMIAIDNTIITGKKSTADLTYGSCGIIRISENSRVSIAVIAGDTSAESMINLDRGKVFLTLGKLQNTGFKVKTPTVVASVRGTSFVVSADVVKGARLSVMKGTVTVVPVQKGEAIAGKEISVGAGQKMDYVSSRTVDQVLKGHTVIAVKPMTEAEIIEIKNETIDIRVDEIKDLDDDIKREVKQDVIEADPKILMQQAKGEKPAGEQQGNKGDTGQAADNKDIRSKIDEKREADEQRSFYAEEKKKAEEEQRRKERVKEKASSIPTL